MPELFAHPETTPAPTPARETIPYNPALDGMRAIAVIGVLLYHGTVWWTPGGFLGVDVFFTLSGYLITTLLLLERSSTGGIDLQAFWVRRARRLLPALIAVLLAVAAYAAFFAEPVTALRLRWDSIAALFYLANWRFVFSGQSYFEQFASPSPLRHTWSLAIEEQWYLIWPIVFSALTSLGVRRTRHWVIGLLVTAGASALLMLLLFDPAGDASRAYYGTDTRVQSLVIGAALAFALRGRTLARWPRWVLEVVAAVGFLGILAFYGFVDDTAAWMYRGGFALLAVTVAATIAVVVQPTRTLVHRALSLPGLPMIGRVSYGLYLWHWPIYVLLDEQRTGLDGDDLLHLRLVVTAVVAALSYNLLEMPIRKGSLARLFRSRGIAHPGRASALTAVGAVVTALVLLVVSTASGFDPAEAGLAETPVRPGDTKVMLVGDSLALGLGYGLDPKAGLGVAVRNLGIPGCGVIDSLVDVDGKPPRQFDERCPHRTDLWRENVEFFRPDVVVMAPGATEVYSQDLNGQHLDVGTPEYRDFLLSQLERDLAVLSSSGARLVILGTPCFNETVRGGLTEGFRQRRDPSRVQWLNDVWSTFAARHPDRVQLIDVAASTCPGYVWSGQWDGVPLQTDGVHYTDAAAAKLWAQIAPQLQAAGRPR